ncbi:MAG: SDR family oxidoreductase [Acidobacteriota bacterium]
MATWLVTGAGRGIGLEFARQLAARGEKVIGTARRPEEATKLRALGARVESLEVGDPASIAALASALRGTPIDVLVNNAGTGGSGAGLGKLEAGDLARYFAINATGPLLVTQALLGNLEAGSRKLVASITSRMGSIDDNGSGSYYGYRASKAALNMVNRSLSIDLRGKGFTCVVLHPGWVRTDMGGSSAPLSPEDSVRGLLKVIDGLTPERSGSFLDHTGATIPW